MGILDYSNILSDTDRNYWNKHKVRIIKEFWKAKKRKDNKFHGFSIADWSDAIYQELLRMHLLVNMDRQSSILDCPAKSHCLDHDVSKTEKKILDEHYHRQRDFQADQYSGRKHSVCCIQIHKIHKGYPMVMAGGPSNCLAHIIGSNKHNSESVPELI